MRSPIGIDEEAIKQEQIREGNRHRAKQIKLRSTLAQAAMNSAPPLQLLGGVMALLMEYGPTGVCLAKAVELAIHRETLILKAKPVLTRMREVAEKDGVDFSDCSFICAVCGVRRSVPGGREEQ